MKFKTRSASTPGIGLLVIAVGLLLLVGNFSHLLPRNIFHALFTYWPCILIGLGVSRLLFEKEKPRTVGVLFVAAGLFLQASVLGWLPGRWALYWPVFFLLIGIWFLLVKPAERDEDAEKSETLSTLELDEMFRHRSVYLPPGTITGGKIAATCASVRVSFSGPTPEPETSLVVDGIVSSVVIRVPVNWNVRLEVETFLGSVKDSRLEPPETDRPALRISGNLTLSSLTIRRTREKIA